MPSPTDSIDLSPSLSLNEIRNSPLDDSGETSLGQKKNQLTNCALEEQVERDRQRKLHRRVVFWLLAPVCLTFYGVFLYAVWSLYSDLTRLANIPVAWVFPIVSLVTVPTILLVIMTLCLYREKNNVGPSSLVRIAESAISASK